MPDPASAGPLVRSLLALFGVAAVVPGARRSLVRGGALPGVAVGASLGWVAGAAGGGALEVFGVVLGGALGSVALRGRLLAPALYAASGAGLLTLLGGALLGVAGPELALAAVALGAVGAAAALRAPVLGGGLGLAVWSALLLRAGAGAPDPHAVRWALMSLESTPERFVDVVVLGPRTVPSALVGLVGAVLWTIVAAMTAAGGRRDERLRTATRSLRFIGLLLLGAVMVQQAAPWLPSPPSRPWASALADGLGLDEARWAWAGCLWWVIASLAFGRSVGARSVAALGATALCAGAGLAWEAGPDLPAVLLQRLGSPDPQWAALVLWSLLGVLLLRRPRT